MWCTKESAEDTVLSVLFRVFPNTINPFCPREQVVIGTSLPQIVAPPEGSGLPQLWIDPDGVDDLKTNVERLLSIIR